MEIINEAYSALMQYFNGLSYTGYRSYNEVSQLLALLFIEDLLYGPLSDFITDEDYKAINNAMYCLYGSCLIPYPTYLEGQSAITSKVFGEYRITETEVLRGIDSQLRSIS